MSSSTPLLLVTDVGLAAASIADPRGPFIHITGFKIGSAYGYTPQRTDTGLNGNTLYAGQPIAYQNIGDNTINIVCRIPTDAGPFDFGEVGIYLGDNQDILFAKAVFDSLQTKFSSLGTNLQSTFTFNCLLKLEQSTAVFKIDTEDMAPAIWEVDKWSDIYPSGLSANPDIPSILVRELDQFGNSSFVHKATDDKWTLGTNYHRYGFRVVTGGSTTSVQFAKTQFPNVNPTTAANRDFVIEFADGYFRSVSSVIDAGADWLFNLNPDPLLSLPTVGSTATLYNCTGIAFASLVDVPLMTQSVQGIARADHGIQIMSPGIIAVNGLNHDAPGTGRVLSSNDNLNNPYLASGIYTIGSDAGYPANYPPVGALGGVIHISNTTTVTGSGVITQIWYPSGTGGGDATGKGAAPAYFRSLYSDIASNLWTSWRRLNIGGGAGLGYNQQWLSNYGFNTSYTNTSGSPMQLAVSVGGNGLFPNLFYCRIYIDGVQVNWGYGSYNNASNMSMNPIVPDGSSFLVTYSGGGFNGIVVLQSV